MKVLQKVRSVFLVFLATLFFASPVLAITQQQLEDFANNNIMFYDPEGVETFNCYSSSAYTVQETDIQSYIWNYFVNSNIPNISNNAEAIAGILGNFHQENSTFDPFKWGGEYIDDNGIKREHARGIYRAHNSNFNKKVESVFGSDVWDKPLSNFTDEQIKTAVQIELDFMTSPEYDWNAKSMGEKWNYPKHLDVPTTKAGEDGAAAYAELFMLLFERPENWRDGSPQLEGRSQFFFIEDSGVKDYEKSLWGTNNKWSFGYEKGQPRRSYWARYYYNRFVSEQIPSTAQTTLSGSDITIIGDETVSNISSSLQNSLSGIDIKTANNITSAAELLTTDSSIRQNIFLSLDLSKELIGEENLTTALSNFKGKTLYFILDTNQDNNDNYTVNSALINSHQGDYQTIYINKGQSLAAAIVDKFKKPVTNMCNDLEMETEYLDATTPVFPLSESSATIPCVNTSEQVKTNSKNDLFMNGWYKGNIIKDGITLCYLPDNIVKGSDYQTMQKYSNTTQSCGKNVYHVPDYSSEEFKELEIPNPKPGRVIVNSRVSGAFLSLATHLKTIINKNEPVSVLSSFRTVEFQKLLYGVTPFGSGCNWGGYINAGKPGTSSHNGGFAIDLNLEYLNNSYNNSPSFKNYIDNYISTNNLSSNSCASVDVFSWKDRTDGRWDDNIHKYLCAVIKDFGFYFTVPNEPWHIEAREK